ncbi:UDP-2,4-diacetamido-2,4,6-trideoxy-beta-L-altropyranose hydrolase [Pseudoalteromonas sp. NCCP-2140]|uniref:UDP-2,4-diacetamido-2,4, 6-trideoxy-beta-L-altropyranose hydrolase n=1 Tax=Pseudoalteromonas sp. NCCP-2140 TaxID=2942288 RepID=UPI0020407E2A|nr:UDP-2,4-diacetamido-2,4,6-trideoxy-beta-L-altropyranose hydrolase [Pseudoalteromonas sp. NCCP-2140]GKW54144.1 UDP-2,4-diacetamido-2,4,6-trideoxy-beta-L-altropyranose hydrolase [Pseudoalteromonas sp. NCCP-2140]
MLNVAFRVDASIHIGSGHVMRCLVLADALASDGHQVAFLTRPQAGDLISFIKQRGHDVCPLSELECPVEPVSTDDYAGWLQVSELDDATECAGLLTSTDLVIVDHYGIGTLWHKRVKETHDCKVVVIDDLVRTHDAELIIDQTLQRHAAEYNRKNANALVLAGTQYALIAPVFATYHQQCHVEKKSPLRQPPRILLSMGGIDAPNATLQALQALQQLDTKPLVTVLLSQRAPNYDSVKAFSSQYSEWVTHIDFVSDMAVLMTEHTLAIGAPGSTSWERACVGLPSIIIALAENQQTISRNLALAGAAKQVELSRIQTDLVPTYHELLSQYEEIRKINLQLCDGQGVQRVVKAIKRLSEFRLKLRPAITADIEQVYEWQCKPETRKYALNKAVPSFSEHQAWMTKKLAANNDYFYIIELVDENNKTTAPVGVVRLDNSAQAQYTISIFIDADYFGKGIGKYALQQIDNLHPDVIINATVLKENAASQALFRSAGYQRVNSEQFTRPVVE